jgi:FtsP/CotA-like multicopper oxidase with cupredoxin domain
MNHTSVFRVILALLALLGLGTLPLSAEIFVQCPGDTINNGQVDTPEVRCIHFASGDGFITLGDGQVLYMFGFSDVTGVPSDQVMTAGALASNFPAPLLAFDEGDHVYLNLSNVSLIKRPDLFDPHTLHFHGHPNSGSIFDGLPESAIAINTGATATYFYQVPEAGTFMYHCHAEATEHMQMGMLGQLYVRPKQNRLPAGTSLQGFTHQDGYKYAYNDGDGSTRYDVELAIQLTGLDSNFHDLHEAVQPLPFALMKDNYGMMNGRGYPDTVNPNPLPPPSRDGVHSENGGKISQHETAFVQASQGQKILIRLSNLNVTRAFTLMSLGMPMQVVGKDASLHRGATGADLSYRTNSIHLGSGETADILLDTSQVAPGTYFLYAAELGYLSNFNEDFGGMMTEIQVNP